MNNTIENNSITIYTTNDIHGRFTGEKETLDFARMASMRKANPNSIFVDSGDATQGTPFAIMKKGLLPIEVLNLVGYDLMTIGNHEFDNITKDTSACELDDIIKSFKGDCLAANLRLKKSGENYIQSLGRGNGCYRIKTIEGKNLLFIGIVTPDMSMDTKRMEDFSIEEMDGILQRIKDARSQAEQQCEKLHAVIVISHLGLRGVTTSTKLAQRAKKEQVKIDLILDGHSHDNCNEKAQDTDTMVIQTGCYGKEFSKVLLNFEGDTLKTISADCFDNQYLKKNWERDPQTSAKLDQINGELEETFGKVWSSGANCTLWGGALEEDKPYVLKAVNIARYAETNLGGIVAEAMISTVQAKRQEFNNKISDKDRHIKEQEYVVGAINGGGLRDSIPFDTPIRSYELFNVLPSPLESKNESGLCVFRITLGELKEILENSIKSIAFRSGMLTTSDGRFLNVAGLRFRIKNGGSNQPIIDSDVVLSTTAGYSENDMAVNLDKDKNKTVLFCTTKYIGQGGDGYTVLKEKTPVATSDTALFQLVGEHIFRSSSGGRLYALRINDNVCYEGFDFKEPEPVELLLTNQQGETLADHTVAVLFDTNGRGQYRYLTSDHKGKLKLQPPGGNSILRICCMTDISSKAKGENLFGELYFHTYYMAAKSGKLTICLVPIGDLWFPRQELVVFQHTALSSKKAHYSNYLNYLDWDGKECSYLIADGQIYVKHGRQGEYLPEEVVRYQTEQGEKKSFSMKQGYKTWGGGGYEAKLIFD